ncbi:uroporphyrinogen-III methyltransferase [Cutibacterium acnes JCM 18916]|nr:uroporphyrinogen-III methyltransferase [Cutibacterium acnes JCM 18916]
MLTVAGFEAVRQADVILYDRLAPTAIMDENPQAERIPVGKVPRGPYVPQERTNELLIEHAKAGRKVVRLKGGDSFVFLVAVARSGRPALLLAFRCASSPASLHA